MFVSFLFLFLFEGSDDYCAYLEGDKREKKLEKNIHQIYAWKSFQIQLKINYRFSLLLFLRKNYVKNHHFEHWKKNHSPDWINYMYCMWPLILSARRKTQQGTHNFHFNSIYNENSKT